MNAIALIIVGFAVGVFVGEYARDIRNAIARRIQRRRKPAKPSATLETVSALYCERYAKLDAERQIINYATLTKKKHEGFPRLVDNGKSDASPPITGGTPRDAPVSPSACGGIPENSSTKTLKED